MPAVLCFLLVETPRICLRYCMHERFHSVSMYFDIAHDALGVCLSLVMEAFPKQFTKLPQLLQRVYNICVQLFDVSISRLQQDFTNQDRIFHLNWANSSFLLSELGNNFPCNC